MKTLNLEECYNLFDKKNGAFYKINSFFEIKF